jgi:hypothetical protein
MDVMGEGMKPRLSPGQALRHEGREYNRGCMEDTEHGEKELATGERIACFCVYKDPQLAICTLMDLIGIAATG